MRNILVVDPYTVVGGPHRVMVRIIKQLQGDRYHFVVAVPDETSIVSEQIKQLGAELIVVPGLDILKRPTGIAPMGQNLVTLLASVTMLTRRVRKRGLSLVHSTSAACWVGGITARLLSLPSVYHLHNLTLTDPKWFGAIIGRVLDLTSDRIICVSQAAKEALPAPKLTSKKSIVVYNGVDPQEFYPDRGSRDTLRDMLGLRVNTPIVASFGALDVRKGQEFLVKAAARVVRRIPSVQFIIVGGDSLNARRDGYGDRIRRLVERHGLAQDVVFLGARADVPFLMRAVDLVVQPSLVEAGPLVPLEAMASGVPVVATNVGAHPEEIVDGVMGVLVPSSDGAALADAIVQLLGDGELRKRMGDAGRAWVETRFTVSMQAERIASIYEQIV